MCFAQAVSKYESCSIRQRGTDVIRTAYSPRPLRGVPVSYEHVPIVASIGVSTFGPKEIAAAAATGNDDRISHRSEHVVVRNTDRCFERLSNDHRT